MPWILKQEHPVSDSVSCDPIVLDLTAEESWNN